MNCTPLLFCFQGVEGGFDLQNKKYDIQESYTIVVLPDWTVLQLSDPDIPPQV